MRLARKVLLASMSVLLLYGSAWAEDTGGRPNGDSKSDLAPLDQSGHSAEEGPLAHANTPPIGGATVGGGSHNPQEMGPKDAERDSKQHEGK